MLVSDIMFKKHLRSVILTEMNRVKFELS